MSQRSMSGIREFFYLHDRPRTFVSERSLQKMKHLYRGRMKKIYLFSSFMYLSIYLFRHFKKDLSRIPLQCVRTVVPERGWGGHFHTFTEFLSTPTSIRCHCLLECGEGLLQSNTKQKLIITNYHYSIRLTTARHVYN